MRSLNCQLDLPTCNFILRHHLILLELLLLILIGLGQATFQSNRSPSGRRVPFTSLPRDGLRTERFYFVGGLQVGCDTRVHSLQLSGALYEIVVHLWAFEGGTRGSHGACWVGEGGTCLSSVRERG